MSDPYRINDADDGWFEVEMLSPVFDAWYMMGRFPVRNEAERYLKLLKKERPCDAD